MILSNYHDYRTLGEIDIESILEDYFDTHKQSQFYQPSGFYYFGNCFLNLI